MHKGIDFISTSGDKNVRAVCCGVVRTTPYDKNGFGNYISVQQDDGYRALYCHLEKVLVKSGQRINEGQIIGIEGTTGNSTGIHLHFEIRETPYTPNNHINVANYLGIKNKKGIVVKRELSKEEKKKFIKEKVNLDDNTMKYFEFYRFSDALIEKLYKALENDV